MLRLVTHRFIIPATMASLLVLALAYWWLDNGPHEIFGTVLFGMLVWHLWVNRRWFLRLHIGRYDAGRWVVLVVHIWLAIHMAVLLITSAMISRSVLGFIRFTNDIKVIEFHWFSAYWVMMIVAIHVGSHWRRVMMSAGALFKLSPSRSRTFVLRSAALILLVLGTWSFAVLDVSTKLMFGYSIEFWDFTASVMPFFAHWIVVLAGVAVVSHYAFFLLRPWPKAHTQTPEGD